jgi:hypothetical protein
MGWKETCAVEERMRFMVAVEKGEESFAAICRQFGVSRRIGYNGWRALKRRGWEVNPVEIVRFIRHRRSKATVRSTGQGTTTEARCRSSITGLAAARCSDPRRRPHPAHRKHRAAVGQDYLLGRAHQTGDSCRERSTRHPAGDRVAHLRFSGK